MKSRMFSVVKECSWHSIGCNAGGLHSIGTARIVEIVPTVGNVEKTIARLFPGAVIDSREMTVYEQIHDSLDCGYFSIDLYTPEIDSAVETYHISFSEL